MINMKLENKVVLITGGSRGIGKAIGRLFAQHGAQVIITSKNGKLLKILERLLLELLRKKEQKKLFDLVSNLL